MILDNVSMPVAADTGAVEKSNNSGDTATSSVSVKVESSTDSFKSLPIPVSSSVSSVNQNTFVVNLSPSLANGNADGIKRKTNLLEIFSENKGKSAPVVKALGRIVINRTLLKHPKPKPVRNAPKITSLKPPVNATTSRSCVPIVLRSFQGKENGLNKKDDEISGNLASFMNFKLTGLVPSPVKTTHVSTNNTFRVSLNTPEINLSQANRNKSSSFSKLSVISSPKTNKPPVKKEDSDNDLTSLSWLTSNDRNLLKTIRSCNPDDVGISLSGDESEEEDEEGNKSNAIFTAKSKVESGSQGGFSTRQYGQTSYNPNGKPPYSFSCLIFMAVEDSPRKMLPVKEIYSWVCKHFPYFETAPSGWKNSIRHNLSLNKCFKKVEQDKQHNDPGKGSLWCIDPAYRPNLIQALKRTPFYPYLYSNGIGQPLSLHNLANLLPGVRAGRVPLWSPNMSQPSGSSCADPDVASAAMNLLGMMKGNDSIDRKSAGVQSTLKELAAEIFGRNQDDVAGCIPLVITNPAEDHTYSTVPTFGRKADAVDNRCPTPDSEKSAPDAAYEFETCGTDLESDDNLSIGSLDEEECDLADSGFHGLKKRGSSSNQRKRRATRSPSPAPKKGKKTRSSPRNSTKSTQTPIKRGLKVRFQKRGKSSPAQKNSRKRKITPQEGDGAFTSDADSGKDSPKVVRKSRKITPPKKSITIPKQTKKNNAKIASSLTNHASPYGTRSSSRKTRQSKRDQMGSVLQRAAARKMRQHSISADSEDEEIKLAAGSLLHLAGFRSSG